MTSRRSVVVVASLLVLTLGLAACGEESGEGGAVSAGENSLSISLAALTADGRLFEGIESARILLYEGPAANLDGSEAGLVFSSDCVGYGGDRFEIEDLSPSTDYTLLIDLFSQSGCVGTSLALRGIRGGIRVTKAGNAAHPYVVPLVPVDSFLPLPGEVDVHYPLNDRRGRVFHTATAIGDGRVAVVGGGDGIAGSDGDQIIGGTAVPELFDSRTMLFSRMPGSPLGSERVMAHAATAVPGGRLAIAGGVAAVRMRVSEGASGRRLSVDVPEFICYSTCDNPNFVFKLQLLDPSNGELQSLSLAFPRVFPSLDVVKADGAHRLLMAGGVPGEGDYSGYDAFGWDIDDLGGLTNQGARLLDAPRSGHASACFRRQEGGDCIGLAYLGGVTAGSSYLEWMGDEATEFTAADLSGAPVGNHVLLPGAGGVDGLIFTTGGVAGSELSAPGRLPPAAIAMSSTGEGVYTTLDLGDGFPQAGELLFHTVTPLPGRRVLVAGGLDYDLRPTSRAFVVRADGGEFVIERTLNLNAARFGHTATVIEGGPLDGAVLILGGLSTNEAGGYELVRTGEIMLPSSAL